MRIVIDLQGAQTASRKRGIGRYTLDLTHGIIRNREEHEVILVLNDMLSDSVLDLRDEFRDVLPRSNIRVWSAPGPTPVSNPENKDRADRANAIREAFIESLEPDVVLVTSLFEGLGDDAVTSVNTASRARTAVILYDLIPLAMSDVYLKHEDRRVWYMDKIEHLKSADLLMSISAAAGQDGVNMLGCNPDSVVNIKGDANAMFRPVAVPEMVANQLRRSYGIRDRFLMYTGGTERRKNITGLIKAFAKLQAAQNGGIQLVIVCDAQQAAREKIAKLTRKCGLQPESVVVTGYVSDIDLLNFYNICTAFVFPSLMEGFGLPVLEAMRCGAPVIASNTSSLPEVVSREEALFDPADTAKMAAKIEQVMIDEDFRQSLAQHGLKQAKSFSWDRSAKIALAAIERLGPRRAAASGSAAVKKRLAYVSPLPPEKSGISDYSAELLPALAEHYDIDVVVDQKKVTDPWITGKLTVRDVAWFAQHHHEYDRILYHFGNSQFHRHMFGLIGETSGVVVLHDFFLSAARSAFMPETWLHELHYSHGYQAIAEIAAADPEYTVLQYPANLDILQLAYGTIVHSDYARQLAIRFYGPAAGGNLRVLPQLRAPVTYARKQRAKAKADLKLPEDSILIASFGMVDPAKLNNALLKVFLESNFVDNPNVYLVFVGANHGGLFGKKLKRCIAASGLGHRIRITGWIDNDMFRRFLNAADIAVQLRGQSRGETSRTVLDCMAHGIPTIVNANGSMAELDPFAVRILPDAFDHLELTAALEELVSDVNIRDELGSRGKNLICTRHDPSICSAAFNSVIEDAYAGPKSIVAQLVGKLSKYSLSDDELALLSQSLSSTFPTTPKRRTIFVDVSILASSDKRTGIERVARSILRALLKICALDINIIPVRRRGDYRYAMAANLMSSCYGLECGAEVETAIDFAPGDFFLALELDLDCPQEVVAERDRMRRFGVDVRIIVYDLLPIKRPDCFPTFIGEVYSRWLQSIVSNDGAICISSSVADELRNWIAQHRPDRQNTFDIKHFHLGADISNSVPSKGMPDGADAILASLAERPSFLSVGTIEPRKGIRQTLDAFELLWGRGVDVNLVLVGKQGWMVDDLAKRLTRHAENGRRLFWLAGISDEFLERVYVTSTCLIAASEGEGFGLPLIEAAQHGLPIIARDLPVFQEVATSHATFFSGSDPHDLAALIERWLDCWNNGRHIKSDGMPWITWEDSAAQILRALGLGDMVIDTSEVDLRCSREIGH